ncbi:uncharacterized protein G2W53_009874 [Senna tora]|uniref:Uncharacterized protein n=1 Tax=Senna tora TaxID=362788 RepID=A0A834WZD4_9FABA|nr:uncharacterized protein G2W53_009874 [Senna tora]
MLELESSRHRRSVDHVITYSGRQITIGSQKPSRITRQRTCCTSESNTLVCVVLANCSGFDVPIGVVKAWEERGSCLNLFRTTNHGRISETLTNYEAKVLLRKHGRSVDHVLTYSKRKITVGSQKPSRVSRQKTCCASESNTSVRVVFANRSGFDAPIRVVMAWEDRGSCLTIFRMSNRGRIGFDVPIGAVMAWEESGSCLNVFRMTNRGRMSETFTNFEAKDMLRKNLHELRGKRLVAQVSETRRFALYSGTGVDLMLESESSRHGRSVDPVLTYFRRQITFGPQKPSRITRVIKAWEERGSCLNIFRTTNRDRISETFTNYNAKDLLRKTTNHDKISETFTNYEAKDLLRKVIKAREERGSCLNIFRMTNRGRISETFTNYEAWEELGSCLNIFRTTNHGRISETFMNYEAKDLLRKSVKHVGSRITRQKTSCAWSDLRNLHELRGKRLVAQVSETRRFALYLRTVVDLMFQLDSSRLGRSVDHVLTYSGRQITKPSRISRQKTCCASESNTSVRVVFVNQSGFDAPIGVVMAWEDRGSCLNIFRMTNRGRMSETFTNFEAKHLFRK